MPSHKKQSKLREHPTDNQPYRSILLFDERQGRFKPGGLDFSEIEWSLIQEGAELLGKKLNPEGLSTPNLSIEQFIAVALEEKLTALGIDLVSYGCWENFKGKKDQPGQGRVARADASAGSRSSVTLGSGGADAPDADKEHLKNTVREFIPRALEAASGCPMTPEALMVSIRAAFPGIHLSDDDLLSLIGETRTPQASENIKKADASNLIHSARCQLKFLSQATIALMPQFASGKLGNYDEDWCKDLEFGLFGIWDPVLDMLQSAEDKLSTRQP